MHILVLEASTASAKAMLYKSREEIIDISPRNYSADAGDTITFDTDEIIMETILTGKQLLEQRGISHVDMVTSCSIWSHSLLMLDKDKKPVSRISTWADTKKDFYTPKFENYLKHTEDSLLFEDRQQHLVDIVLREEFLHPTASCAYLCDVFDHKEACSFLCKCVSPYTSSL